MQSFSKFVDAHMSLCGSPALDLGSGQHIRITWCDIVNLECQTQGFRCSIYFIGVLVMEPHVHPHFWLSACRILAANGLQCKIYKKDLAVGALTFVSNPCARSFLCTEHPLRQGAPCAHWSWALWLWPADWSFPTLAAHLFGWSSATWWMSWHVRALTGPEDPQNPQDPFHRPLSNSSRWWLDSNTLQESWGIYGMQFKTALYWMRCTKGWCWNHDFSWLSSASLPLKAHPRPQPCLESCTFAPVSAQTLRAQMTTKSWQS